MKKLSCYISIVSLFLLCGCKLKYHDISKDSTYSALINTTYVSKVDMYVSGINLPPDYNEVISVYFIYPVESGRSTGPEVITEAILKPGLVVKIKSVRRSVNHLLGFQTIEAVVEVASFDKEADVNMIMNLNYIQSADYMRKQ